MKYAKFSPEIISAVLGSANQLKLRDYIAIQQLYTLLNKITSLRNKFSIDAYHNLEIASDFITGRDITGRELIDLSLHNKEYDHRINQLMDNIHRGLLNEEDVNQLKVNYLFSFDNISTDYFTSKEAAGRYSDILLPITQWHLNKEDKSNKKLKEMIDKVSFIGSLTWSEKLLLKIPVLKNYIRSKYEY